MNKLLLILTMAVFVACQPATVKEEPSENANLGKLFIIGGGDRPPELVKDMLDAAEMGENDYVVVLPMSSSEPDTSFYYAKKPLVDLGIPAEKVINFGHLYTWNNFSIGTYHHGSSTC